MERLSHPDTAPIPQEPIVRDLPENETVDGGYVVEYGSKQLKVYIEDRSSRFFVTTFLENTSNRQRLEGETTRIYTQLKSLLQDLANSTGMEIDYGFSTRYPGLAKWAISTGSELFNWNPPLNSIDQMQHIDSDGRVPISEEFMAVATIYPQQKETNA